jgi:hypothetical protein
MYLLIETETICFVLKKKLPPGPIHDILVTRRCLPRTTLINFSYRDNHPIQFLNLGLDIEEVLHPNLGILSLIIMMMTIPMG